jgi:hypothetical protein
VGDHSLFKSGPLEKSIVLQGWCSTWSMLELSFLSVRSLQSESAPKTRSGFIGDVTSRRVQGLSLHRMEIRGTGSLIWVRAGEQNASRAVTGPTCIGPDAIDPLASVVSPWSNRRWCQGGCVMGQPPTIHPRDQGKCDHNRRSRVGSLLKRGDHRRRTGGGESVGGQPRGRARPLTKQSQRSIVF